MPEQFVNESLVLSPGPRRISEPHIGDHLDGSLRVMVYCMCQTRNSAGSSSLRKSPLSIDMALAPNIDSVTIERAEKPQGLQRLHLLKQGHNVTSDFTLACTRTRQIMPPTHGRQALHMQSTLSIASASRLCSPTTLEA